MLDKAEHEERENRTGIGPRICKKYLRGGCAKTEHDGGKAHMPVSPLLAQSLLKRGFGKGQNTRSFNRFQEIHFKSK